MYSTLKLVLPCLVLLNIASCELTSLESPVDLTWNFDNNTIYWVGTRPFSFTSMMAEITQGNFCCVNFIHCRRFDPLNVNLRQDAKYKVAMNEFCAGEHGGTHIDAPYHFHKEGRKVGDIPLHRLIANGAVIDISYEVERLGPNARLEVYHLIQWELEYGPFQHNTVILIKFGWSRYFGSRAAFLGTNGVDDSLTFPGISAEAAQWIANTNRIVGVGVDTASVDLGSDPSSPAHRILCARDIYLLENVKLLEDLPACGFTLLVMPMKIREGTGAPVRLVATPIGFAP